MGYAFTLDDVQFLTSTAGDDVLHAARDLELTDRSLLADLTRLRRQAGAHASAVAETVILRRRATARWRTAEAVPGSVHRRALSPGPSSVPSPALGPGSSRGPSPSPIVGPNSDAWFFADEALQQATPPPVAAHRARRLAAFLAGSTENTANTAGGTANNHGVHDITCSIGADLFALCSAGIFAIGSDLDPVRLAMAHHNLEREGLPPRVFRADARTITARGMVRYADPARRDAAGRRISSADTIPSVAELDSADSSRLPVLRLPPGIDYERLARPGEIEIVSWRGIVREAVAWPPDMATAGRRATVLGERISDGISDGHIDDSGTGDSAIRDEFTDVDPAEDSVTAGRRYLIDPDPAVVRAHLVRQYAARYLLTLVDPHLAYLTGDTVPAGVRGFEIDDEAPYSERCVRDWVRRDKVGTLEIRQRGTSVIPDELRRRIRPRGDTRIQRTLVIARIGRHPHAWWCRAVPPSATALTGHSVRG